MGKLYGGIDGCKGGWVFVYGDFSGQIDYMIEETLHSILDKIKEQSIKTAIDMAVGLNKCSTRQCDRIAADCLRKMGKSGSSVFMMPGDSTIRNVKLPYFKKNDYTKFKDFNKCHKKECGRVIKLSTFCIMNKIFEINRTCLDQVKDLQSRELLFEFHPALFFNSIKSGLPKKKEPQGFEERCNIVKESLPCFSAKLLSGWRKGQCSKAQPDDFVDAAAGMILASRYCDSNEISSDQDVSEQGLRISIRY